MNTEATHDKTETLSTGVRLRNAREQLGLSQQAVAERLCLKVSTVRDIEEDKALPILLQRFCVVTSVLMQNWCISPKKNCCR